MSFPILSPVFTAQSEALVTALDHEPSAEGAPGPARDRMAMLLRAVLPDVVDSPAKVKRLVGELGQWLVAAPRSWREVEEARRELDAIISSQVRSVARVLTAATSFNFDSKELAAIRAALDELTRIRAEVFAHWRPFGREDYDAAMEEIRAGKVHDLDEVIRELQGRAD